MGYEGESRGCSAGGGGRRKGCLKSGLEANTLGVEAAAMGEGGIIFILHGSNGILGGSSRPLSPKSGNPPCHCASAMTPNACRCHDSHPSLIPYFLRRTRTLAHDLPRCITSDEVPPRARAVLQGTEPGKWQLGIHGTVRNPDRKPNHPAHERWPSIWMP